MTNESPGYRPEWISHHGEALPADAQAILRDNSEAQRLLRDAGLDMSLFAANIAEANSLVRLALEDGR